MKLPRELPRPMFIRPNDYVTLGGADYIVKRNEFGQMVKIIGRVSRKLPAEKDVIWALNARRAVAYWGNKYFMWERIDDEVVGDIMEDIWAAEVKRGVPKPVIDKEGDIYDF